MDWPLKTVSSLPFKDTFSEPLPVKDGCHCGIDPVMLKAETTVSHLKVAWFQLNLCNGAHTRVIRVFVFPLLLISVSASFLFTF